MNPEHPIPPASVAPPRRSLLTVALIVAAVALPIAFMAASRFLPPLGEPVELFASPVAHFPPCPVTFQRVPLGGEPRNQPLIASVRVVDWDGDHRDDVLVCDTRQQRVFLYRQREDGTWEEQPLGEELNSPACATPVDLDRDGDPDLVVAVLGSVYPTNEQLGQVVWLENRGGSFVTHVLLDQVRRVSDVQAGDLDGDGDPDLAVAVFGYYQGEVLWLENRGDGRFEDHQLFVSEGPSHVSIADADGDGDLDMVALVSQDHEEVWAFVNEGGGVFRPRRLHAFTNFDLGSAGLIAADLDRDGDQDFLLAAGDNLEVNHHFPQSWHGVYWLENKGDWTFAVRQIGAVGGVYAVAVADFDADGDTDVAAACMFNDWHRADAASLVMLMNDGKQNFTATQVDDTPVSLATLAVGLFNNDKRPDLVAGSLNLWPRKERLGRLTLWLNSTGGKP